MADTVAVQVESEQLVTKKKNNGSVIWRYFGFRIQDEQQSDVLCKACMKKVTTKGGNTTNLFSHLQQNHRLLYEESVKLRGAAAVAQGSQSQNVSLPKQSSLKASLISVVPYDRKSKKWRDITKAVAFHIAKDMVPIAVVEKKGFINMLKAVDPRYQLPSRNHFAREVLPEMYSTCRKKLAERLAKVTHFGLTTDMWTSRTCEPYMCLTVHFIEDWEMKTACLQTSYFPDNHTGEHIAEALQHALVNWGLDEKGLVAITTDNGSNIIKAVELNEWLRMQCFGHRLHLAIGHGMDDSRITRAISLCKKIVSSFSYSWLRRRELSEVQQQLGLPTHQLITESATRWGSRQLMIERILEQEGAITKVLSSDKKTRHQVLTWQDTEVLETVQKALKPLQEFTDALSGEDYVTLSYVRPVLDLFSTSTLAVEEGDTELCRSIKSTIVDYLTDKYSDPTTSDLLDMATFVDPRFKDAYIPRDRVDALKQKVVEEAKCLLAEGSQPDPAVHTLSEPADQEVSMAPPPAAKKKKSLASFFKRSTVTSGNTPTQQEKIENELSSYLLSARIESDTDPLKWWRENEMTYPALSKVAKKYLLVPATSSPSERVFSCSGNIVSCYRASLKPETVDRLVFLAQNL